jgi:hypothetical protein
MRHPNPPLFRLEPNKIKEKQDKKDTFPVILLAKKKQVTAAVPPSSFLFLQAGMPEA